MRQDRLSKENLILYALGLIPVIWAALLVAPALSGGLPEILKNLTATINNPFHIVWSEDTPKCILLFVAAYGFGIGIYLSTARNYRRREEHGSAKWGNCFTVNKKYMDKDSVANKLLTQNVCIGLDSRRTDEVLMY
jgi:type IV secretion system protein VirD4